VAPPDFLSLEDLLHITQNHPFLDGNKRTGAVAAIVFLALNGVALQVGEDDLEDLVCRVATGQAGKSSVAAFLRANAP
jgi:death-on-curing protein